MTSIVEKLKEIKDYISLQGKSGVEFDKVNIKFALSSALSVYVLKHLRNNPNYNVINHLDSNNSNIGTGNDINRTGTGTGTGVTIIASHAERCAAYGIQSPDFP